MVKWGKVLGLCCVLGVVMVQAIGRDNDTFPPALMARSENACRALGCEKRKTSQANVLDVMMSQAIGRDNDTVPTALLLSSSIVHGSFLVVLLKIFVDPIYLDL